MKNKERVVVIFRRLGPYHAARLNAAARYFDLCAIEYSSCDDTYAWAPLQGGFDFSKYVVATQTPVGIRAKKAACERLHQILAEISPIACALPGWAMTESLMGLKWCIRRQVPAILMTESTVYDHKRTWYKEWVKGQIVRQYTSGLAGGSPQAEYAEMLGMPRDRIFLGYDVVDNNHFASRADFVRRQAEKYRKLHRLPDKYFLASARFIEKKNLPLLLEAYANYLQWDKNIRLSLKNKSSCIREPWHLVVLGDGPLRKKLESKVGQLDIYNYVHFPGFKQYEELPIYYSLAQAFVLASTSEQWGLVVNEAMASGLPVLVSERCGCARDLVKHGINGFVFSPFKREEISQYMVQMASMSDEARQRMGSESVSIISKWGIERFASGLKDAVACACSRKLPSPKIVNQLLIHALIYL